MRLPSRLMTALPLSAAVLMGPSFMAGCQNKAGQAQMITTKDLTPEARATLEREMGDAKLSELSRTQSKDRGTMYSAEFSRAGTPVEIEFGPDGLVHGVEERMNVIDLPQNVRDAVYRELPTARIVEADKQMRAGVMTYEVGAELRLSSWELVVSPEGTILNKKMTPKKDVAGK